MTRTITTGLAALLAALATAPAAGADAVSIETLSNRADLISDGDALVAVDAPKGVRIALGSRDVTSKFGPHGGRLEGLVSGLKLGANTLTAKLPDGRGAKLTITNHPRGGPVFSGPQIQPWYCLPDAFDQQCNRA